MAITSEGQAESLNPITLPLPEQLIIDVDVQRAGQHVHQSPVADRTNRHCRQLPIVADNSLCEARCVNCASRRVPFAFLLSHKQHIKDNLQCTTHKIQQPKYNRQYITLYSTE